MISFKFGLVAGWQRVKAKKYFSKYDRFETFQTLKMTKKQKKSIRIGGEYLLEKERICIQRDFSKFGYDYGIMFVRLKWHGKIFSCNYGQIVKNLAMVNHFL